MSYLFGLFLIDYDVLARDVIAERLVLPLSNQTTGVSCSVCPTLPSPLTIPWILIHVMYHANNCLVCHTFDPQYHHMVPATVPSWSASSIPIWCSWQHNKIHQTYLCEPIRWWGRKCGFNNGVCNKAVQSVNIFNKLSFLPSYQHRKIKMWLCHSCCNVEQCLNEHSYLS